MTKIKKKDFSPRRHFKTIQPVLKPAKVALFKNVHTL